MMMDGSCWLSGSASAPRTAELTDVLYCSRKTFNKVSYPDRARLRIFTVQHGQCVSALLWTLISFPNKEKPKFRWENQRESKWHYLTVFSIRTLFLKNKYESIHVSEKTTILLSGREKTGMQEDGEQNGVNKKESKRKRVRMLTGRQLLRNNAKVQRTVMWTWKSSRLSILLFCYLHIQSCYSATLKKIVAASRLRIYAEVDEFVATHLKKNLRTWGWQSLMVSVII